MALFDFIKEIQFVHPSPTDSNSDIPRQVYFLSQETITTHCSHNPSLLPVISTNVFDCHRFAFLFSHRFSHGLFGLLCYYSPIYSISLLRRHVFSLYLFLLICVHEWERERAIKRDGERERVYLSLFPSLFVSLSFMHKQKRTTILTLFYKICIGTFVSIYQGLLYRENSITLMSSVDRFHPINSIRFQRKTTGID